MQSDTVPATEKTRRLPTLQISGEKTGWWVRFAYPPYK